MEHRRSRRAHNQVLRPNVRTTKMGGSRRWIRHLKSYIAGHAKPRNGMCLLHTSRNFIITTHTHALHHTNHTIQIHIKPITVHTLCVSNTSLLSYVCVCVFVCCACVLCVCVVVVHMCLRVHMCR